LAYRYDASGNTTCRPSTSAANTCPSGAGSQTLTWDAARRLSTVSDSTGTSSYTYTADGVRLVGDDPAATTLYLPGTEIKRAKATGTVTAVRYFQWDGQVCAMKTTGGAVTWLITDHHGTQTIAVAAGDQTVTARRCLAGHSCQSSRSSLPVPQTASVDPLGLYATGPMPS